MFKKSSGFTLKRGFTLIELLVVISIIGVLVGISSFGLQNLRSSSRDATRKADLAQIQSALELFRSDHGRYPVTDGLGISGWITSGQRLGERSWIVDNGAGGPYDFTDYMDVVPRDPINVGSGVNGTCVGLGNVYSYRGYTSEYHLAAILESGETKDSYTSWSGRWNDCNLFYALGEP